MAIGFFVREQSKLATCHIHYASRRDEELDVDILSFLRTAELDDWALTDIIPDKKSNWLDLADNEFDSPVPGSYQADEARQICQ